MTHLLLNACSNDDLHTVINEIDKGVDPSADNNFAIRWAADNGHLAVVESLLQDHRVDPAISDNFTILLAAKNGRVKTVVTLLDHLRRSHPDTIEALKKIKI